MTADELSAIRARLAAATPGPMLPSDAEALYRWQQAHNEMLAHAPADITALLQEVERLQDECDTWEEDSKIIGDVAANSERVELEIIAARAENARLRDEVAQARVRLDLVSEAANIDPSKRRADRLETQLARAVELLKLPDCWEHADNCCRDWCSSCKDGHAAGLLTCDFLRTTEGGDK